MSALEQGIRRCERCDRDTSHVIESVGEDNRPHYLCWSCVEREEKHQNRKPGWRQQHRSRRYQPASPTR